MAAAGLRSAVNRWCLHRADARPVDPAAGQNGRVLWTGKVANEFDQGWQLRLEVDRAWVRLR